MQAVATYAEISSPPLLDLRLPPHHLKLSNDLRLASQKIMQSARHYQKQAQTIADRLLSSCPAEYVTFTPHFDGDKSSVFLRLILVTRMPFRKHKVSSHLLPLSRGPNGFVLRLDVRKLAGLVLRGEN